MKSLVSLLLISILFISCSKDRISADGNIRSEIRNPGAFTNVHSSGSNNIHILYGTIYKVEVKGSANLISRYETRIVNNRLTLGYDRVNVRHDDIEVFVTMPTLSQLSLSGSGDVDITGNFPDQNDFTIRMSGSGSTTVYDTFKSVNTVVDISGSGNVRADKVRSIHADVKISGSGDVRLTSEEVLKVLISGSGKVFYTGNAVVDARISGSGQVIKF